MENGLLIQILFVTGIIAYGVWSAARKGQKRGDRSPHRTPGGENFPFPAMDAIPNPPQERTPMARIEDQDRLSYLITKEPGTHEGIASTVLVEETGEREEPVQDRAEKQPVTTDLRTMIISSELLKPKYEEY